MEGWKTLQAAAVFAFSLCFSLSHVHRHWHDKLTEKASLKQMEIEMFICVWWWLSGLFASSWHEPSLHVSTHIWINRPTFSSTRTLALLSALTCPLCAFLQNNTATIKISHRQIVTGLTSPVFPPAIFKVKKEQKWVVNKCSATFVKEVAVKEHGFLFQLLWWFQWWKLNFADVLSLWAAQLFHILSQTSEVNICTLQVKILWIFLQVLNHISEMFDCRRPVPYKNQQSLYAKSNGVCSSFPPFFFFNIPIAPFHPWPWWEVWFWLHCLDYMCL